LQRSGGPEPLSGEMRSYVRDDASVNAGSVTGSIRGRGMNGNGARTTKSSGVELRPTPEVQYTDDTADSSDESKKESTYAMSGWDTKTGQDEAASKRTQSERPKSNDLENVRKMLSSISFQKEGIKRPEESKSHAISSFTIDKVPHIQANVPSVAYSLGSFQESFGVADNLAYNQTDSTDILNNMLHRVDAIDTVIAQGREFVHMLYTYRNVSRAVPDIEMEVGGDDGVGGIAERLRRIVDVLRPEISKLHDLQTYAIQATEVFRTCLLEIPQYSQSVSFSSASLLGNAKCEILYPTLVRMLDVLMQIDALKDIKITSLMADFTKYKLAMIESTRAHYEIESNSSMAEETTLLEQFLDSPDPRRKQHYVFQSLCEEILRHSGFAMPTTIETLVDITMTVASNLQNKYYVTPEDKFVHLRVLPFLIILIDNISEEGQQVHTAKDTDGTQLPWITQMGPKIFKAPTAFLLPVQQPFLQYPVVPLFGDITLVLVSVLERSPRYKSKKMGAFWGSKPDSRLVNNYDIGAIWENVRGDFGTYSTLLIQFLNSSSQTDTIDVSLAKRAFDFTLQGINLVSEWSCVLRQVLAWKLAHPASLSRLQSMGAVPKDATDTSGLVTEYEQSIRFNMTPESWSMYADVISMVKALVCILQRAESKLAPLIRFHCHHSIQNLVQAEILPLTHRVDKRKTTDLLPILLQIRAIAADWIDGEEPLENYKQHKRKLGIVNITHPLRVVSSSSTQLRILRSYVRSVYSEASSAKMRYGIMGRKTDLEPSDISTLESFYRSSFFFSSVLKYSSVLTDASDLSYLWYREYHLEMAGLIQFPIEFSIPWILTEHVSTTKGVKRDTIPLVEKLFYILDIYNDASQAALFEYGRQHLYNEAEAEANLVLDQIVYLFSEEAYIYYKNCAAISAMEKSFRSKLEELKRSPYLTWNKRRFDVPLAQRNIQLLGRSVDFNFLVSRHMNDKLRADIDCALRRFESGSVTGIPELQLALDIVRSTHEKLSTLVDLDTFNDMLAEVDESFAPSSTVSIRGRMASHLIYSLVCDVFPNFSYNFYTQRFVPSPIPPQPCTYGRAPKRAVVDRMLGPVCAKAHERAGHLTRGFFGRVHLEAMLQVFGYTQLPRIVDECLQIIADKLQDLTAYVIALGSHVPACHLPHSCAKNPEHAYHYFHSRLVHILDFDDLKPEVFQTFRYVGNALGFFRDLSSVLEIFDQFEFSAVAPLMGLVPDASANKAESYAVRSPLLKALRNFARADINPSEKYGKESDVHQKVKDASEAYATAIDAYLLQQLPGMAHRSINVLAPTLGSHNLFESFLGRFHTLFVKLGLLETWDLQYPDNSSHASGKFIIPAPCGFQRLWATLSFFFYEQEVESGDKLKGSDTPYCGHEDEFGHGFFFAGAFFSHVMNHKTTHGSQDYGDSVLRVHFERFASDQVADIQALVAERKERGVAIEVPQEERASLSTPVSLFIDNATLGRQLFQEMTCFMKALGERAKTSFHHGGNSDGNSADAVHGGARHSIQLFHPPRDHAQ
jgi:cytoplasmic FMR1 interacting protein